MVPLLVFFCILCIFTALNFPSRHKYPQSDYHCCAIDSRFNNVNERNHGSHNTERLVSRARFFDRLLSLLLFRSPFSNLFLSFFSPPSFTVAILVYNNIEYNVRFKKVRVIFQSRILFVANILWRNRINQSFLLTVNLSHWNIYAAFTHLKSRFW